MFSILCCSGRFGSLTQQKISINIWPFACGSVWMHKHLTSTLGVSCVNRAIYAFVRIGKQTHLKIYYEYYKLRPSSFIWFKCSNDTPLHRYIINFEKMKNQPYFCYVVMLHFLYSIVLNLVCSYVGLLVDFHLIFFNTFLIEWLEGSLSFFSLLRRSKQISLNELKKIKIVHLFNINDVDDRASNKPFMDCICSGFFVILCVRRVAFIVYFAQIWISVIHVQLSKNIYVMPTKNFQFRIIRRHIVSAIA